MAAQKPAVIANVASIGGVSMLPGQTAYILTKHAVLSLTESLYLEMRRAAPMIQVSVVMPGPLATQIFADALGAAAAHQHHRAYMQQMLGVHGMAPDEAGRTIMDQIQSGRFWIATHPKMLAEYAKARAEYLAELKDPSLTTEGEAILGQG